MNINDRVLVTLTDAGRQAAADYHRELSYNYPKSGPTLWTDPRFTATGETEWHLWELFTVFGEHVYLGMPKPMFEQNEIRLKAQASASPATSAPTVEQIKALRERHGATNQTWIYGFDEAIDAVLALYADTRQPQTEPHRHSFTGTPLTCQCGRTVAEEIDRMCDDAEQHELPPAPRETGSRRRKPTTT
jgi:hypothetical protein